MKTIEQTKSEQIKSYKETFKHSQFINHAAIEHFLESSMDRIAEVARDQTIEDVLHRLSFHEPEDTLDEIIFDIEKSMKSQQKEKK